MKSFKIPARNLKKLPHTINIGFRLIGRLVCWYDASFIYSNMFLACQFFLYHLLRVLLIIFLNILISNFLFLCIFFIPALYGLMFPQDREAAFSNFFFWSFLGYFLSYSYANYFNVAVKINIMMTFLIVGIVLYLIGQVKLKCCSHRNAYVEIGEDE